MAATSNTVTAGANIHRASRATHSEARAQAMPRVLQVVLSLNPGGTERLVLEIVRRLASEIPMAVCCLDAEGDWAQDLINDGISVSALRRPDGFTPRLGAAVARVAAAHHATVLHCHHYSPFVYSALARIVNPRLRIVFTEHGRLSDTGPSPKRRLANRVLSWFPHEVYTVSGELRAHVVDEGFPAHRVGVIYNGIPIGPPPEPEVRDAVRRDLGAGSDTFVVGTVARLDPVKDLGSLIEAAAAYTASRPLRVVIVGDGPERSHLEQKVESLGVRDRVTFLGHRNDARRWLAGYDAFVNCSVSEGVSLTILEAMAAGLPVVATRVGGTPEVVEERSGLLINPRQPSELAGALQRLSESSALGASLGRAARQRVEAMFTIERMVDEYRAAYYRVG